MKKYIIFLLSFILSFSFVNCGGGGGGETGSGDFRMTADPDWDAVNGYTF